MKQRIRLNETQFNSLVEKIVKESVKRMIKEYRDDVPLPKFEVGDKIKQKGFPNDNPLEIIDIRKPYYYFKGPWWSIYNDYRIRIEDQDDYVKVN